MARRQLSAFNRFDDVVVLGLIVKEQQVVELGLRSHHFSPDLLKHTR